MDQRKGSGWLNGGRISPGQKHRYIPFPSAIHVVCGTHSTSRTPPLVEWQPHTHKMDDREKETAGWMVRTRVWQREGYVPLTLSSICLCPHSSVVPIVSSIHIVCGAHTISCTPPLAEWGSHIQHGWQSKGRGWLNRGRTRAWQRQGYITLPSVIHVCVTIQPAVSLVSSTHAVCGAHWTSHISPLVEWGHTQKNKHWWPRMRCGWLNGDGISVWQRDRYTPFSSHTQNINDN